MASDLRSRKINNQKIRLLELNGTPRHEQLFNYSKVKAEHAKLNRKSLGPDITFTPSINTSFECERTRLGFFERQQADCREREYKQKLREEANSTVNLRKMMIPAVNRPIQELREDLGQSLYEKAFKLRTQLDQARDATIEIMEQKTREEKILPTSKRFMEDLTRQRLTALFEQMDSDGDGLISAHKIDVEVLDPQICKVLASFFLKLSDSPGVSLDMVTFLNMMDKYLRVCAV